jgi:hypothetical protein
MHDDDDASGATLFQALKNRRKLAIKVFAAVFLVAGGVALLTRQYSASAVVALNPAAGQPKSAVELAWTALSDKQIGDIIDRLRLNTAMARLRAQGDVSTYLQSNFLLRQLDSPGSRAPEVVISYTGDEKSSTIQAVNAVAQVLASAQYKTDAHPVPTDTPETSGSNTQPPSQNSNTQPPSQNSSTQPPPQKSDTQPSQNEDTALAEADLQRNLKIGAQLQAALQDTMQKLAALQQESKRALASAQRRYTPPPAPPPQVHQDPRRLALEQQIRQEQSHLNDLLQRYTGDYPDVQDARETLSGLQAKLRRLPPEKTESAPPKVSAPLLPTSSLAVSLSEIAKQQDELQARQSDLEQKIRENHQDNGMLRSRLADLKAGAADSRASAKDDALQQHNNAPPQVPDAAANSTPATPESAQAQKAAESSVPATPESVQGPVVQGPLFTVIKTATTADPLGLFPKPLFWVASLFVALIAASSVAFLAERFAPLDEEIYEWDEELEDEDEESPSRSVHTS